MADFVSTFSGVFVALILAKVADKVYMRYLDARMDSILDNIHVGAAKTKEVITTKR